MYAMYNPNPKGSNTGDCTIRAMTKAVGKSWEDAYIDLAIQGFLLYDMPSANHVWGAYLMENGYSRRIIPNTCPECYTVEDFCQEHPYGTFVLCTGTHVVTVVDGVYYDSWDSGEEVPIYYYERSR